MDDAVPFDFGGPGLPLVVVPAELEAGEKLSVVVDTGAVAPYPLFLSEALAKRLKLELSAAQIPQNSVAVGPAKVAFRTARLAYFRLGPVELRNVDVAVSAVVEQLNTHLERKVDAIIGQQFLKGRIVSIDYAAQRFDLTATPGKAKSAIPTLPAGPFTVIPAKLNGKGPFAMEIDTGASDVNLSPEAAARAGLRAFAQAKIEGAGGSIAGEVGTATIAFGPIKRTHQKTVVHNGMDKVSSRAGIRVDGIVGGRAFEGLRITIDYPGNRVWAERVEN